MQTIVHAWQLPTFHPHRRFQTPQSQPHFVPPAIANTLSDGKVGTLIPPELTPA